jgi:hypothetical protein
MCSYKSSQELGDERKQGLVNLYEIYSNGSTNGSTNGSINGSICSINFLMKRSIDGSTYIMMC